MQLRLSILLCLTLGGSMAGCTTPASDSTAASSRTYEQQMRDLTRRYEIGAIGKPEYERERAALEAQHQRDALKTGTPLNETIRGSGPVR